MARQLLSSLALRQFLHGNINYGRNEILSLSSELWWFKHFVYQSKSFKDRLPFKWKLEPQELKLVTWLWIILMIVTRSPREIFLMPDDKQDEKLKHHVQPSSKNQNPPSQIEEKRREKEEESRCYFRRYRRNLSVTYFKYLRSFSIRLKRHDCQVCLQELLAEFLCFQMMIFDADTNWIFLVGFLVNWSEVNGLVSFTSEHDCVSC